MVNMLFYVNHQSSSVYDVFAGVQVNANLQALVSAFPGALGTILGDMLSSDAVLSTSLNVSSAARYSACVHGLDTKTSQAYMTRVSFGTAIAQLVAFGK